MLGQAARSCRLTAAAVAVLLAGGSARGGVPEGNVGSDMTSDVGAYPNAPILAGTTRKVRLVVARTTSGNPSIREFEAYNDTTGGRR